MPGKIVGRGQQPVVEIRAPLLRRGRLSHGAKGIVLAGVGDGNTSKQALEAAAKKGILVVRSTRVRSGFVTRNVEVDDDKNGFVVSEDLNPEPKLWD